MFDGQIAELPLGQSGYNANHNISQLTLDELLQANNCTYEFGTLQKEGGSALFTPSPLTGAPTVLAGFDWWPTPTIQRSVIFTGAGALLKDSGPGSYAASLKTGLSVNGVTATFCEAGKEAAALNKKLMIYTGGANPVQVLSGDGVVTTNLANPPADWSGGAPLCGAVHLGRHWATGGTSDPFRLYYSRTANHEDFVGLTNITGAANNGSGLIRLTVASTAGMATGDTETVQAVLGTTEANGTWVVTIIDATHIDLQGSAFVHAYTSGGTIGYADQGGSVVVYPGVGSQNVFISSFKRMLIVGRYPRGLFMINTTDPVITNWQTIKISDAIGMAGPGACIPLDDDYLFMDAMGKFHLLSDVREFGDFGFKSVGDDQWILNFIKDKCNLNKLSIAQGVMYAAKREAHFALPQASSSTNNIRLVVDFNSAGKFRFRYSDKDALASLWLARDTTTMPRITGGDALGQVWTLDQTNKAIGVSGSFTTTIQTSHFDMSHLDPALATKRKEWKFLEVVMEPKGNWSMFIDIYLDGTFRYTKTFNLGTSGVGLGSFVLGTSQLASDQILNKKIRIVGTSRRISFVITQIGAGQDMSLARMFVHFKPIDEREP